MKTITIELTDTENTVLHFIAADPQFWVENFTKERCRIAMDEIINMTVRKCLDEGVTLPSTRDAIVALAFERKWVGG